MSEDTTTREVSTEQISPNDLISGFGRTPVAFWLFIALGAHVLFIGLTSFSYINDTWLDPAGAEQRRLARRDSDKPDFMTAPADTPTDDSQPAADTASDSPGEADNSTPPTEPGDDTPAVAAADADSGDKTAVEERVSDSATASELDELEKKFFKGDN